MNSRLPRVVADTPLNATIEGLLSGRVEVLPWTMAKTGSDEPVEGIYTYGHPQVAASMLDRLPGLKVISNYGVGVDHIDVDAAAERGIAVGNTPGVLEGTTADLGFALLLASARLIVAGRSLRPFGRHLSAMTLATCWDERSTARRLELLGWARSATKSLGGRSASI